MAKRATPSALPSCTSAPLARRGGSASHPNAAHQAAVTEPAATGRRHVSAAKRAERRQEFWQAPAEALLSRAITAAGIGYTVGWLEWVATHGGGPVITKIGRAVRYRKADVLDWLEANSQRLSSTGEPAKSAASKRQVG